MQENGDNNKKEPDFREPKKSVDKTGVSEYNSQCCREGRERERATEREQAILENDIEK